MVDSGELIFFLIKLSQRHLEEIYAHARFALPTECCGLLGGRAAQVSSVYQLENVAVNPLVEYEAAPKDLFAAHKLMRERGENLSGIYHSHPRQAEPVPSETDVRRAFYPDAVYFIVGFDNRDEPLLRAFHISEVQNFWTPIEFQIIAV